MSREGTLIKNTAIITIGKICTQLITFFLLPLYTSLLSTQEYGIIDLLNTLVSLLVPIVTLQIEQGIFRDLIEVRGNKEKETKIISTGLIVVSVQMLGYLLLYVCMSGFIHNDYKVYLVLNILVYSFASVFLQVARGFGNNRVYATASFLSALSTILSNVIFLLVFHMRAEGMLLGTIMGQSVCILYLFFSLNLYKYIRIQKFDKNSSKRLLKYSIPLIPNSISWWIFNASDRVIVSAILGVAQNGILSAASKFSTVYITFYNIFNISWMEAVSLHIHDKDINEFFNRTFNVALRFFVAMGMGIIACMPFAYPLLLHEKFRDGYVLVPILIVASLFNVVVGLISVIYVAKKNTKAIANTSFVSAILNITIHLILIRYVGLYAAAISTLASFFIMSIYRLYDINKHYFKIQINHKFLIFTVLVASFILVCYYVSNWKLQVIALVVSICYAVIVNKNMLGFIVRLLKQKMGR